ncbi:MAG: DUF134 domain-containing protein [bacterium]
MGLIILPRPKKCRCIWNEPRIVYFKPRAVPLSELEEIILHYEEYEAVRLADLEGFEQVKASKRMKISRQTFGRVLQSARKKIADAVVNGKALKVKGGDYMVMQRKFRCSDCDHSWEVPYGTGRPSACPKCESSNIHRAAEDRGFARQGGGFGRGRCRRSGGNIREREASL